MKKIFALFLVLIMSCSFVACNQVDKALSDVKKNKSLCSECLEKNVGQWLCLNEVVNENVDSTVEQYELLTLELEENETLVFDENEYKVEYTCDDGEHHAEALDADGNSKYKLYFGEYEESSPGNVIYENSMLLATLDDDGWEISGIRFIPASEYTIVELTEENWKDYFSETFYDHFEMAESDVLVQKDEWGEITSATIQEYYQLKNAEKYKLGTVIALEFSCDWGWSSYDLDLENTSATNRRWKKNDELDSGRLTLNLSYDACPDSKGKFIIGGDRFYHLTEEQLEASEITIGGDRNWSFNPTKILRMKGWLVIKK